MASSHSEHSALVYCYNCSREGHFGYECSERRMHGSIFPTSPFIYYYDDEYDIKRRANRLKRKVAELQEAGLLPIQLESPLKKEKHMEHSHKKRKKPWKEYGKHHKDDKYLKKTKKKSQADKLKVKKHRHDAERGHGMEEDFPRECKKHALKGGKKWQRSVLQAHGSKTEYAQEILEAAKRKKKRKKQKDSSPNIDENLFLIKQRKRKSKQKSNC